MTASWDSLFFPSAESSAVAAALRQALLDLGYIAFDPFASFPGKSYSRAVRLFVAPQTGGWVRVIGAVDRRALAALSADFLCLEVGLAGDQARVSVWAGGSEVDPMNALQPYVRLGSSLFAALADSAPQTDKASIVSDAPLQALPDDVRPLVAQVDLSQAQGMLSRFSSRLLKRAGADDSAAAAARALVTEAAPDWNSPGGQRIRALMSALTVPDGWREPDFITLRDAYQLHLRRRRSPAARLYPGDAEALARVPDALVYTPIYAGLETSA
ncbi:MAG: hypothetical protein ACUVSX_16685 [Aggregatilineales bacterium]